MTKPDHRRERSPFEGAGPAGHRHARIESALQTELTLLLRDEITDPSLDEVSIRSTSLSADLHVARVQFTLPGTPSPSQILSAQRALERASGFLRSGLASALDLKRTPALKFVYTPGTVVVADDADAWWK